MNLSESYNLKEFCSMSTTKFAMDLLFANDSNLDCSSKDSFKPFDKIGKQLLNTYKELGNSKAGTQIIIADRIIIEKSTAKGNTILLANDIKIQKESTVSSYNSGCTFSADIIGSPSLFVSHSFDCGLNAGSFGGRGGIGISEEAADTLECIKNGYSRMSVYGEPLLATSSGSPGSPYSIQDKLTIAPGAIAIITRNLYIDKDSKIQGGYLSDNYDITPSSSGGSIAIVARSLNIKGKVMANGQSSNKETIGEGSGGRISLYKACWYVNNTEEAEYSFSHSLFEALAGQRPFPADSSPMKPIREKYEKLIRASNGSKIG
jgi:hypothetical protein